MSLTWIYTLASVGITSLIGFIGIITFSIKGELLKRIVLFLVSFSAGALFGDAFLHLLPEAVAKSGFTPLISLSLIAGLMFFFILEKIIFWRHCHVETSADHPHPFAWMNLFGDGFHNFIDGMVIAGSYLVSFELGLATTLAVILHEIPQEIGDYGVLVHGGFGKIRALFLNFYAQLASVAGALLILTMNFDLAVINQFLVPFTAGGFIYIAGSDLIPELKKEVSLKQSLLQLTALFLGIALMALLLVVK